MYLQILVLAPEVKAGPKLLGPTASGTFGKNPASLQGLYRGYQNMKWLYVHYVHIRRYAYIHRYIYIYTHVCNHIYIYMYI